VNRARTPRRASLFWTFAGAFLFVLMLAAVLQVIVVGAVVGPLARTWLQDRAHFLVREAAVRVATLPADADDALIAGVLREVLPPPGRPAGAESAIVLLFRHSDGELVSGDFPHRGERRRGRWRTDSLGPPEAGPRERGPWRDAPPQGGLRRFVENMNLLASEPVADRGEVLALARPPRFPLWPAGAPTHLLLFLPLALLLSGAAGLVLFRIFLKRLRALETLAARVAEGDLQARVESPGADEIGLLGERLNRMTEGLVAARRRVEDADRQRRRLLADISHELGTPLTSIRGYAETLLDPQVPVTDEERRRYLHDVLEEAKRLDLLIRDLFEITRLESGAPELEMETLDWTALVRNTMARFEPRFRDAGLALVWGGELTEAWVRGDGRRLEQVIENLLTNALRYVPEGGEVRVSIARAQAEAGDGHATADAATGARFALVVEDDGPGIPAEHLPHVFERFFRADPARPGGGTGLGLAIVKEIMARHGGTVTAANRAPRGARLRVELPAAGS
jgi:signal transduction histidine kinase